MSYSVLVVLLSMGSLIVVFHVDGADGKRKLTFFMLFNLHFQMGFILFEVFIFPNISNTNNCVLLNFVFKAKQLTFFMKQIV